MGAPLDDLALLQHDDLVAVADRAQAMGDDDAGAAAAPQIVVDDLFGDRIERAGRLVEHDHRGIGNQRPGDLDALALAAAEIGAAFVDVAVVVSGRVAMSSWMTASFSACDRSASVTVGSHSVRLSRAVPSNRKMSWST